MISHAIINWEVLVWQLIYNPLIVGSIASKLVQGDQAYVLHQLSNRPESGWPKSIVISMGRVHPISMVSIRDAHTYW